MPRNFESKTVTSNMNCSGMVYDNRHKILELLKTAENGFCADCRKPICIETAWAVLSYGIFVCDDCKLIHIHQENHYKPLDGADSAEISVTGILSTCCFRNWEEKDMEQMKANGNEKVNEKLLRNVPMWLYRPMGNDGIRHKEHWIRFKYEKDVAAVDEPSKIPKKSFHGIQFSRPIPKGTGLPCCAILQADKLYLTSDVKNEEISIEHIETVYLNSTGKDNCVRLTYRTSTGSSGSDDHTYVTYTYLQHDNMEIVLEWINHILRNKFNLLQEKYSSYSEIDIAKMLNCVTMKESYMAATKYKLIYVIVSEARIACFQHHLDEKPLFHLPISKALKLTGGQYLRKLAQFFDMDFGKISGHDEWTRCLERALKIDKLSYLADDILQPILELKESVPLEKASELFQPEHNSFNEKSVVFGKNADINNGNDAYKFENDAAPTNGKSSEKSEEKFSKKYECYPPIGPMGEMGKVARGELPEAAIRPMPPKVDLSRVQMLGMANSYGMNLVGSSSLHHSQLMGPGMSSLGMMRPPFVPRNTDCYPPLSGPTRDMPDTFQPMPRMPASDGAYMGIAEMKQMNFRPMHPNGRATTGLEHDAGYFGKNTGGNGFQSSTNFQTLQQHHSLLGRSTSWNSGMPGRLLEHQQMRQEHQQMRQDLHYGQGMQKSAAYNPNQFQGQTIMENLHQLWLPLELELLSLIQNSYVPASDMTKAGLDANSVDHAQTCVSAVFDPLLKRNCGLALSFLRGFREIFSHSSVLEIRNLFIGAGELDTMKRIFFQQGREEILKSAVRGASSWKQHGLGDMEAIQARGSSVSSALCNEFSRWSLLEQRASGQSKVFGFHQSHPAPASMSDSLNTRAIRMALAGTNENNLFNRAPSRPASVSRPRHGESYPTEASSFGSKTPSDSTSPGVVTPPSMDASLIPPVLTGIETTLMNMFQNSGTSGSSLWN